MRPHFRETTAIALETEQVPVTVPAVGIPFNKPSVEGNEITYLQAAVERGHSSAKGPFTERVVQLLRDNLQARDVVLTTSCTAALEMSAMMLDLRPGDTVIVPSFTFVTTALAFARQGARLVFADIEPRTLGIDPAHVAELITERTKAVVPVHYAGVGCDIYGLADVLAEYPNASLIEDNAHGLYGSASDRQLGTFGRFATLSFHETKNFVCGEGGALVLNRPEDIERAHILCDKGTNRRAFQLGQVDKYTWVDEGSSFGMADLLAAYLLGQLEARDRILGKRRAVFERYKRRLEPEAAAAGLQLMQVPRDRVPAYHMFYILLSSREQRDRALRHLNARGYMATFHYVPLHTSPKAVDYSDRITQCPVTDDISGRLLRLPFYNDLPLDTVDRIAEELLTVAAAG